MRDLAELVRLPAALTVPGDSVAGAAAAGWPLGRRTAALPVASACLYWAGMALNDYSDRELDAVERPERPIPSGRVTPGQALAVATGLTGLGLAAAACAGRPALRVAVPLAATVWAYDLLLKPTPAGPLAMGTARALDVLLGAGGARAALPAALSVGGHTLAVTQLSRDEVSGSSSAAVPAAALASTALVALATAAGPVAPGRPRARAAYRLAAVAGAGTYAATVGKRDLAAVQDPSAATVRRAVGAGIHGMMPLQAALAARSGALAAALPVAAIFPLARALSRKVSPT
ncbi:SCO3242 family prenyltransferase [Motilibacter aurantiacus]|uniref:SCO3242 family prenyltransferase n=1 Tax=Motilibacter aurantiacus TaxID=2714955 RepID=UPI00140C4E53|nr:UbiA family prenyltransferase [Motilibacter aurantiacus]NHC45862.1 UbiA family prenyltransferase [Motilibacter aurantiacus]